MHFCRAVILGIWELVVVTLQSVSCAKQSSGVGIWREIGLYILCSRWMFICKLAVAANDRLDIDEEEFVAVSAL